MARASKVLTVSLPQEMFKKAEKIAREENRTRSELFREALRQYISTRERWQSVRARGARTAEELGIRSEEDIERLIQEFRSEHK